MDISNYKCAIFQYTCDDCMIGNNFVIKFDFNKGDNFISEKGTCSHIDITFHSTINKNIINCFI